MIHHLFVLDFVMIIILQKQKRQNCMKAQILFRVLLTIICIICNHEDTTANSLSLDLQIVPDSSYHDGNEHRRDEAIPSLISGMQASHKGNASVMEHYPME